MDLKIVLGAIVAAILFFFGVMYTLGSVYAPLRLVIAVPLLAAGFGIVYYIARKHMPARPTARVKGLVLGIVGGIIGALIGGFIMDVALQIADIFYYASVIISGAIAGSFFGRLTNGNRTTRGLIGCAFALVAVMAGYCFIYITPMDLNGVSVAPYNVGTFSEFLGVFLEPIDYLLMLCGIGVGFLSGGRFLESKEPSN